MTLNGCVGIGNITKRRNYDRSASVVVTLQTVDKSQQTDYNRGNREVLA